ncbi:MAG TPA: hypothetical protein VF870_12305 [Ignavibacteriaceae bacterium]
MQIVINKDEHVFDCGRSGTGKSKLAEIYTAGMDNVIVLDTKGDFKYSQLPNVPVFESLEELQTFKEGKAIYRPNIQELNSTYYELFFEWIYFRKNCTCLVDEILDVCPNSFSIPFYAKAILTRGRSRNTQMWGCTQRPKGIPTVFLSEAIHYFVFDLNTKDDRKRIVENTGSTVFENNPNDKSLGEEYFFYYYNVKHMEIPIKARLKL